MGNKSLSICKIIYASTLDYGTYHFDKQQRLDESDLHKVWNQRNAQTKASAAKPA